MTAHWAHLPYELLDKVSRRIINEVPGVSRVTYDVSGEPPATPWQAENVSPGLSIFFRRYLLLHH